MPESCGKEGAVRGFGIDPGVWSVTQFASQLLCRGPMASVGSGGLLCCQVTLAECCVLLCAWLQWVGLAASFVGCAGGQHHRELLKGAGCPGARGCGVTIPGSVQEPWRRGTEGYG